jgi:hypothetical protein
MKNIVFIIAVVFLFACRKSSEGKREFTPRAYSFPTTAEAQPGYDQSNYGIYKGVMVAANDSMATFKYDIYNSGKAPFIHIFRFFTLTDSLVRYNTYVYGISHPWTVDTTTIPENADFYYAAFASHRIGIGPIVDFSVHANGLSPNQGGQYYSNSTINAIMKETSGKLVRCFDGSFDGTDSGKIAWVMTADSLIGIRKSTWHGQYFKTMYASVSGDQFTIEQVDDISGNTFYFNGTVTGNTCTGTWTKSKDPTVINTFTAIRTY